MNEERDRGPTEVDFDRERTWWDAKAPSEERDLSDEVINRALRWREIERHLAGVENVLTIGAGTGVFSIPLARRGFAVTHVDFSPAMLDIARQRAQDVVVVVSLYDADPGLITTGRAPIDREALPPGETSPFRV